MLTDTATPTPAVEPVQTQDDKAAAPLIQAAKATSIRNPWVCQKCGAIIGSVTHEKVRQGMSISRLILFRGAIKIDEFLPINFVFGKVDAGEFVCSRCGETRVFYPSPETLRYYMGSHKHPKKNPNL